MSATLAQLLDQAIARANADPPEQASSERAITALGHLARAVRCLSSDGPDNQLGDRLRLDRATALVDACSAAADTWAPVPGLVPDLAGAVADLAARWTPQLSPAQRWAIVVALAQAAVDLATTATGHRPYAGDGALAATRGAGLALEQHATTDPPGAPAAIILDRAIPAAHLDPSIPAHRTVGRSVADAAIGAATELVASVRTALAARTLTVADATAAVIAARHTAQHAVLLVQTVTRTVAPPATNVTEVKPETWWATSDAWLAVQFAYAPFDDGTKHAKPRPDNPVHERALQLCDSIRLLRQELDSSQDTARSREKVRDEAWEELSKAWSSQARVLRDVSSQLPLLAEHLREATEYWSTHGALLAPERRLDRLDYQSPLRAVGEPVVIARPADMAHVHGALSDARLLSLGLTVRLDHLATPDNDHAAPNLAAAYRLAVRELRPSEADRRARAAQRRLALDAPPQWGYLTQAGPHRAHSAVPRGR